MNIADFKKLPENTYAFDVWRRSKPVKTALGSFHVELHTPNDRNPPDDEMVRLANDLAVYVANHSDHVWDIIFGSFRHCATTADPDWLKSCGVPKDLTRDKVRKYCEPAICITRQSDPDERYSSDIIVFPEWDEEVGLRLEFRDGAIVTANGSPFKLVDGILKNSNEK
jgi:hypothetical protein